MSTQVQRLGMISHYGLHWSVDEVFWGAGKAKGQLLGKTKAKKNGKGAPNKAEKQSLISDYRDFIGLYCLYSDSKLVYTGEAGLDGTKSTIFTRLKTHRTQNLARQWNRFSWFGVMRPSPEENPSIDLRCALQQLEAITIAVTNPGYNRHNGAFTGAISVDQVKHPKAKGGVTHRVNDLHSKLDELIKIVKHGKA